MEASADVSVNADYVVVGGGIAGVSCAETLARLCSDAPSRTSVLLVTASPAVKRVANLSWVTERLASFDVEEVDAGELGGSLGSSRPTTAATVTVTVLRDEAEEVLPGEKVLVTGSGRKVGYGRLCLCHGARPRLIRARSRHVRGIRDTESVRDFQGALEGARRVLIVGNGGIGDRKDCQETARRDS